MASQNHCSCYKYQSVQVNILTEREKIWMKQLRKEEKKMKKEAISLQRAFDPELLREQR